MRRYLLATFTILSVTACSLQSQRIHFNKSKIERIDLLVGDSSIWNEWQFHQDSGLMVVNGDVYFVDTAGKALHKPMQKVVFIGTAKDSLLDIINSFHSNYNESVNKTCIFVAKTFYLVLLER